MKQYKFDYIKEWVEQWNPNIPKTAEQIQRLPWDVIFPWISLDDECNLIIIPAQDHYGEDIDDFNEWHAQRDEYIRNLAREYETLQDKK